MALSWVRWAGAEQDGEQEGQQTPADISSSSLAPTALSRASHADWAQLLEQASDLNDELCRENCELHSEVALLRQRQAVLGGVPEGQDPESWQKNRATRAARMLPLIATCLQNAIKDMPSLHSAETSELLELVSTEVQRALAAAASSGGDPLASSEETAALVLEKVHLKELSMLQQERLLELELAKEKLSGNFQGHWASRLTSALQQVPRRDDALAAFQALPGAVAASAQPDSPRPPQPAPQPAPETTVVAVVGEEYEVVGRNGAILRESEELESSLVVTLPPGSRICVLELGTGLMTSTGSSRRARVCAVAGLYSKSLDAAEAEDEMPPMGWLSVMTKDGKALIRPVLHRKEANSQNHELPSGSEVGSPPQQGNGAASAEQTQMPEHSGPSALEAAAGAAEPAVDQPESSASGTKSEPPLLEQAAALWAGTSPEMLESAAASSTAHSPPPPPPPPDTSAGTDGLDTSPADMASTEKQQKRSSVPNFLVGGGFMDTADQSFLDGDGKKPVVVSTDAWLALRDERMLRDRQIRALEAQVRAAQRELEQVVQMRVRLRDLRQQTLEFRQEGSRLEERAHMAAEEVCTLSSMVAKLTKQARLEKQEAQIEKVTLDNIAEGKTEGEDEVQGPSSSEKVFRSELSVGTSSNPLGYLPSPANCTDRLRSETLAQSVEWRRLLAERETTAWELSQQLRQVEELEALVEEKRVELQAAEKRRERERRSLLTALKELGARNGIANRGGESESGGAAGTGSQSMPLSSQSLQPPPPPPPPPAPPPPPSQGSSSGEAKDRAFLQKISELEDLLVVMEEKLDMLQARAASLNKSSNVRAAALNYATAASRSQYWVAELLLPEELPSARPSRADIDGLASMLEGLFVENYQLLQAQKAKPSGAAAAASSPSRMQGQLAVTAPGANVDLTPFIIHDGLDGPTRSPSPSSDRARSPGRAAVSGRAPSQPRPPPPPPAAASAAVLPPSPRALRKRMGGLDFNKLSVAE